MKGWIGVDLDGTLAEYHGFRGPEHIGEPIPLMVDRVKKFLAEGQKVKIFTARVSDLSPEQLAETRYTIQQWCLRHIGQVLEVTCQKDYGMIMLYDDRCIQVQCNTGRLVA